MLNKSYPQLIRLFAVISFSYFLAGCGDGDGPAPVNDAAPPPAETLTLVWSDEFDVDGAPNVENWRMERGYGDDNSGWGNDEWQLYTADTSSENNNVRVEAGSLVITARCSKAETAPAECNDGAFAARTGIITSARINSKDKFEVKYGNIQARIKTPPGKGMWPAFWMLGSVFPEQPWPGAGEIDIMEMHQFFSNDRTTHFTMHWCDDSVPEGPVPCQFDPGWTFDSQFKTFDEVLTDDYHIFEADWDEDRIVGKIDGLAYFTLPIDPATQEEFLNSFFMILNVAVGGTLGGPPNDSTTWPQEMLVDWVRVYERNKPDVVELVPDDRTAPLPFERFVNSAEFGGDSVVAKIQRAVSEEDEDFDGITPPAVTPLTGNTIVEFDYESANTFFSGAAFSFKSKDISSFSKVVFSLDTSAFPNFDDIVVEMVDSRNAGGATGKVQLQLSNYIPKVTGNWKTYEIPLSDFNGVNLDNVVLFGFWNPVNSADQLIAGKLYIDGIRFVRDPCTTDGSVAFDSINYNPATSVASVSVDDICAASSLVVVKVETGTDEIAVGVNLDAAGKGETIFNLVKPDSVCSTDDGLSLIKLSLSSPLMATYTRTFVDADGTQQVNTATATAGVDPSAPGTTIVGEKSYFYATDPSQALSFLPDVNFAYSIFGSGSVLDGNFSDTTFDPVFAVTSGTDYGGGIHVAQVALIGGDAYPAFTGFAEGTETINFKIKDLPADNVIDVEFGVLGGISKMIPVDVTTSSYSTSIVDGWYEISIPMTEFPDVSVYNYMAFTASIGTTDIFTFLITDIFLQESAGNVPAECDNVILPPVAGSGTGATGTTGGPLSVSFDDSAVAYGFTGFGDPDTITALNADPVDGTNLVAVTTKPVGAQVWAGVTVETVPGITWPLTATNNQLTIRIYAPGAGLTVLMKLEEASSIGANFAEAQAVTTVDTGWETLTFTFVNPPAFTYDKLSLFFGFGTAGDGTAYTWDTIEFLGAVPPPAGGELLTNGTFEAGDTSGWSLVANDGTFTATMDQAASGVWSGNLVASVPAGGGPASFPVASQNNFALGTVTPGQSVTVSFDICGELTGAGGVVQTALLSEIAGGGASATDQLFGNITPTDTWVNYTMTTLSGTDVTGGLTLQLKSDCGGNPGCTVNAYFDNVSVVLDSDVGNPSNAGGSCAGGGGAPTEPTVAAPTPPSRMASGVKSMFSDSFTDEPIDTWRTSWSNATLDETFVVGGSATKLYTALDFVGIEATAPQIDASAMTHFHVDVWTPDDTTAGVFRIKLVDFGASTTEFELVFDSATTPALTTGSWSSLDIPLSDFTGLAGTANIQQLIFSATLGGGPGAGTVYIDNVYFYDSATGPATEPPVKAPVPPTRDAGDVKSMFSDAYTDEPIDTWRTIWSVATLDETFVVDGSATKLYTALDFVGIEATAPQIDASAMTHFHVDVWTPNDTTAGVFRIKLVDIGTATTEFEIAFDSTTTPAMAAAGSWTSLDIPLSDFTGLAGTANIQQLIFSATLGGGPGGGTVYIDNVYFYANGGGGGATLVNGDFETGDFTGWTQTPDAGTNVTPGTITLVTSAPGSRAGAVARLEAAGDGIAGSQDVLLTQVLAAGTLNVGDTIDVSFDLYGSLAGAGGVVFVELIYLDVNGVDTGVRSFVDGGAPKVPTTTWATYSDSIVVPSTDVSGGVKLQLKSSCGPVDGCGVDAYFDNVSTVIQ